MLITVDQNVLFICYYAMNKCLIIILIMIILINMAMTLADARLVLSREKGAWLCCRLIKRQTLKTEIFGQDQQKIEKDNKHNTHLEILPNDGSSGQKIREIRFTVVSQLNIPMEHAAKNLKSLMDHVVDSNLIVSHIIYRRHKSPYI